MLRISVNVYMAVYLRRLTLFQKPDQRYLDGDRKVVSSIGLWTRVAPVASETNTAYDAIWSFWGS